MMKNLQLSDVFYEKHYNDWFSFLSDVMNRTHNQNLLWRGQSDAKWEITSSYIRYYNHSDKALLSINMMRYYFDLLNNMPHQCGDFTPNPLGAFCAHGYYGQFYWKRLFARFEQYRDRSIEDLSDRMYCFIFGSHYDCTFGFDMDLSLWAWGQHYGAKTPLVDWTRFALFALFFAIVDSPANNNIAIYSLDIDTLRSLNEDSIFLEDQTKKWNPNEHKTKILNFFDSIFSDRIMPSYKHNLPLKVEGDEFVDFYSIMRDMSRLKIILPADFSQNNARLCNQGGIFSFAPGGFSLEMWCKKFTKGINGITIDIKNPLLTKYTIQISQEDKNKCMNFLENCNISEKTIYPDFQGVTQYVERKFHQNMVTE